MHTLREEFPTEDKPGIIAKDAFADWHYTRDSEAITLTTAKLRVTIVLKTACITYADASGRLLLAERQEESRLLEAYDSFRIVHNENTQVQTIQTADGEKTFITRADKAYDKTLYRTQLHLDFQADEALFGLGQPEHGDFDLRGTTQYLHQANMKIAIPFLLSTQGYGLLVDTYAPLIFTDSKQGGCFYTEADQALDYYFVAGENFDQLVSGYRFLTGKATLLPRWAFGFMQSAERYETAQEMLDTVAQYRQRGVGLDCIVLDWQSWDDGHWGQKTFDKSRFPNPKALTEALHQQHAHMMISIWPNMHENTADYREMKEAGFLLPAGDIYNAYAEGGRKLFWEQIHRELFSSGIDAWWCDSSEPFIPEWRHVNKPSESACYQEYLEESGKFVPPELSNAYALYHARCIFEGQRECTSAKRVVNLTRSAYTGQQRYGVIPWSGDISANWETLRDQISAGLHFCAAGFPYWTLDIGAFWSRKGKDWFRNGDYPSGNLDEGYRELFVRWYQFGAFLPVFRVHGTNTRRELWCFGEQGDLFYDAIVQMNRLRYRLLPTIYALAGRVWTEDYTLFRMLAFDFAHDKQAVRTADQFMLGNALMVCPVTTPMYYQADSVPICGAAKTREAYLPAGTSWIDYWTGEALAGGQSVTADAPIDRIPLYVKAGSILFTGEDIQYADQGVGMPLTVTLYGGGDGETVYYDDYGDGNDYEQGAYYTIAFHWHQQTQTLTIGSAQGQYWEQVRQSTFRIVYGHKTETAIYTGHCCEICFCDKE